MLFPKVQLPVIQNRVFNSKAEALESPKGWIDLQQNVTTGIVSNVLFDNSLLTYDENYDNEQGNSKIFQAHMLNILKIINPFFSGKKLIEVGCGKGAFFNLLRTYGYNVYACDPTFRGEDERVIKDFFSKELGLTGDAIILRHVLEHIQNPVDFLFQIAEANNNKGIIYIEVPDFNWIVDNKVYFDIFYEHVNYFRPEDFSRIFANVIEQGIFFGGQYQYVIADLSSLQHPPYLTDIDQVKPITYELLDKVISQLKEKEGKDVFIWGAGSKGVIAGIYLKKMGIRIKGIIDINPMKQDKYAPVTGLNVWSPERFNATEQDAVILIANPNYADEIKAMTAGKNCSYINL